VYGIEWDAAQIRWYFDGVQYYSVNIDPAAMSEFQAPMFIILNIAVGGSCPAARTQQQCSRRRCTLTGSDGGISSKGFDIFLFLLIFFIKTCAKNNL